MLDVAYKLFTWADGLFLFDANLLPPPERITIPIDLESVIMEGSRRLKEWERLQDELPDLNVTLRFTDRPDARLRNVNLTVEEWRVVSFVNPRNTLEQIARANNLSDFQIRRIVYGLLQAGIVEYAERSHRPEAVSTTARASTGSNDRGSQRTMQHQSPAIKRSVVHRLIERIRSL